MPGIETPQNILYIFSHMPFLTFLPSTSASSSVNRLSDAIASNNSSSAAVFRIVSMSMFYQLIEACLRMDLKITEVVKE